MGLYRTTLQGRILFANQTLVQMLGYGSRSEYQALDVSRDLYHRPSQRAEWLAKVDCAGTLRKYPTWARRADGSRVFVLDSATAVRDSHGRLLYFEGVWESATPPAEGTIAN